MNRDFIDDDLTDVTEPNVPPAVTAPVPAAKPQAPLTAEARDRLARQKSQLTTQVSGTAEELEALRRRQKDLEQEKHDLEALSERQRTYEGRKKETVERLNKWVLQLEKEQTRMARQVEVFAETRKAFDAALHELSDIDEASWSDEVFEAELDAAVACVDDATNVWRRGVARAEAAGLPSPRRRGRGGDVAGSEGALHLQGTFLFWLKVGAAVSVPFALFGIVFFIAWLVATGLLPR